MPKSPKIISLRTTVVSVPSVHPCAWSQGTGMGFTRTVLELTTDSGIVGLGECEGAAAADLIAKSWGRKLVGLAIDDLLTLRRFTHAGFADYGSLGSPIAAKTYAAVEMAMLDAQGKATGLPVYQLLGGAVHPQAAFSAYRYTFHLETDRMAEKDVPDAMAAYAREAVARTGATTFEFKVARYSTETDIRTLRAVRQALGDAIAIGPDANQGYDIEQARRVLRAAADNGIEWFEEPVASFDELSSLRREFPVQISSHCCDPEKLRHYPAIDGVVGDLHLHGGMLGVQRLASAIRGLGRRFWQRSCLELGISWAAMVHAAIACPAMTRPSQTLIDWVEDDCILGPTWLLNRGGVIPPAKPGLGVELDRPALERYAERYRQVGEQTYFDAE